MLVAPDTSADELARLAPKGIILSGGPASVLENGLARDYGNFGQGGAVFGDGLTLIRCSLIGNSAAGSCTAHGGAFVGTGIFIDCSFIDNTANGYGGCGGTGFGIGPSVARRDKAMLHLHRLQDHERLAPRHRLSDRHFQGGDPPRQRSDHTIVGGDRFGLACQLVRESESICPAL